LKNKIGLVEWLKVKALSSSPSTTKKRERERERERETNTSRQTYLQDTHKKEEHF
jgi:hypothetical protein